MLRVEISQLEVPREPPTFVSIDSPRRIAAGTDRTASRAEHEWHLRGSLTSFLQDAGRVSVVMGIRRGKGGSASPRRPKRTPTPRASARLWVAREDVAGLRQRTARLQWLMQHMPATVIWTFPSGWLGKYLFEEARYCFVYGQFIAAAFLGFAFIERTLAAMFYAAGRHDLERATSQRLIAEAVTAGWLRHEDAQAFEKSRLLRNPLVHFRAPGHNELPVSRALRSGLRPYAVVETDAQVVLEAMFRLVSMNAGRN